MFIKTPAGFTKHFGEIIMLPKECVVCGDKSSNEFKIISSYDPGVGVWLLGLKFTYRILRVFAPLCKKHFIQLTVLKYLFWLLLAGIIFGAHIMGVMYSFIIAVFPFVAIKYFLINGSISIYKATNFNGFTEIILAITRKEYYEKVSKMEGVVPIPFPEPGIHLLTKKLMRMALLFLPWIYFLQYFWSVDDLFNYLNL